MKPGSSAAAGEPKPNDAPAAWLSLIARGIGPAALALTLGLVEPARADLAPSHGSPAFSATDLETIARNETLGRVVNASPWLVHRILRRLESAPAAPRDHLFDDAAPATRDIDLSRDPDLDALQRSSPEAAHDLFLLIKQAGKGGAR